MEELNFSDSGRWNWCVPKKGKVETLKVRLEPWTVLRLKLFFYQTRMVGGGYPFADDSMVLINVLCLVLIQHNLRILTPPMETPDPPIDTPVTSKQVFLTPNDIPRILRVGAWKPLHLSSRIPLKEKCNFQVRLPCWHRIMVRFKSFNLQNVSLDIWAVKNALGDIWNYILSWCRFMWGYMQPL